MEVEILVIVLMVVGLVGTVVPGIPGLPLVWAGALAYGLLGNWSTYGTVAFAAITVIAVVGSVAAYVLPARRASGAGAAWQSIALGVALGIAGIFLIPVIGLFVGGIGGVYLGERARGAEHEPAWRATVATLVGFGIGALVEILSAAVCIAIWLSWAIFG